MQGTSYSFKKACGRLTRKQRREAGLITTRVRTPGCHSWRGYAREKKSRKAVRQENFVQRQSPGKMPTV